MSASCCHMPRRDRRRIGWVLAGLALCTAGLVFAGLALASVGPYRSVLYPRPLPALRFSHGKHGKVACIRCHATAQRSVSAGDRNLPDEAACAASGCHQGTTRKIPQQRPAGGKAAAQCAICHLGYRGGGNPDKLVWPAPRIRFSHRMHHTGGVGCKTCHRAGPGGNMSSPSMAQCRDCHRQRKVNQRCSSCHLTQKDGRLVVRFGQQWLRPTGSLRGDRHTTLFARKHASIARGNRRYCETCHHKSQCLACHAGTFKPLSIHASDYISHHSLDARRNEPRCAACHRSQSFCLSCHIRLGVSQTSNNGGFRPSTAKSFHAPGFVSATVGPRHHKFEARRNIGTCTSCHTESTCVRCHGTVRRQGGGFSPHPRDFGRSNKCRALYARNQRVCMKCHTASQSNWRCR